MGYEFEWNSGKARENLRKHGVSFEEVSIVFGDPLALLMSDPDHSVAEDRYLLLGLSTGAVSWWWPLRSDDRALG